MSDEAHEGDEIDAIWARALHTANEIIQRRRNPVDAARELDQLRVELVRLEAALERFVGLAATWDYDPVRRDEIEHDILIAAETFRRNFSP
jgi:hypothetical protein